MAYLNPDNIMLFFYSRLFDEDCSRATIPIPNRAPVWNLPREKRLLGNPPRFKKIHHEAGSRSLPGKIFLYRYTILVPQSIRDSKILITIQSPPYGSTYDEYFSLGVWQPAGSATSVRGRAWALDVTPPKVPDRFWPFFIKVRSFQIGFSIAIVIAF